MSYLAMAAGLLGLVIGLVAIIVAFVKPRPENGCSDHMHNACSYNRLREAAVMAC